jgi:hypothetical protein
MALRRYIGTDRFTSRARTAVMAESLTYSNGDKSPDAFRIYKNNKISVSAHNIQSKMHDGTIQ